MLSKIKFFAAAIAGSLICSAAGAQVRDGAPSAPQPAPAHAAGIHAGRAVAAAASTAGNNASGAQSAQAQGVIRVSSSGRLATRFVPPANAVSFDSANDVPGLGFDFPHLAAIARAQGRSAHFGHDEHGGQGFFVPIFSGGYPYYADDPGLDQAAPPAPQALEQQPQPQIIVIQQTAPSRETTQSASGPGNVSADVHAAPAEAPVPDIGNFILVRRDGRILFASLFSVVGTQLRYITPEGIRRTMALTDLDSDATEQMNEARGTTIQIRH